MLFAALLGLSVVQVAADSIKVATFDGAEETTIPFGTSNDPVMGGQSVSGFAIESGKGIFEGEVKVVPSLNSPGFCNIRSQGSFSFPNLSGTDGVIVEMEQTLEGGLTNWDVSLTTATSTKARYGARWQADFEYKVGETAYFVPYSTFKCDWRGQSLSTCGSLSEQLAEITQIGLGSNGVAGPFRVELTSISGSSRPEVIV